MTLLERLRSSLAPEYDVQEEIGRGGMGAVFVATDRALDRPVAVKVLRPELATARAVERFLREARALAAVDHPRVLQIHRAGEAGGLYYYVMELARGETLEERLERGPLEPAELDTLAADLLDGLAAIHEAGIIHRDVKPSNIFMVGARAVLGDFGVALSDRPDERLTAADQLVGTPRYLAPEQRHGEATESTDLYAAALVLYEACTGVPWRDAAGSSRAWDPVPRRLRRPLRRALDPDPSRRWPDARTLRSALDRRSFPVWAAGLVAAGAAAVLILLLVTDPPGESGAVADLAILPFQVVEGPGTASVAGEGPCNPDTHVGCWLAHAVATNLSGLPRPTVTPASRVSRLGPVGLASVDPEIRSSLRSRYVAHGPIVQRGDAIELTLIVEDSLGHRQPERTIIGRASEPYDLADSVALALVGLIDVPWVVSSFRGLEEVTTDDWDAMRQFFQGEHYFQRNAWTLADQYYRQALAIDTSFALAAWRRWNTYRWQLTGEEVVNLDSLLASHGADLPPVERALLAAEARPPGGERIEALEAAMDAYGYVPFLHWLLADELHHRGPLIGRTLDEAIRQYQEAGARNPYLGPVYEHSLLAYVRLGREGESRAALQRVQELTEPPTVADQIYFPPLLEQAVLERFEPEAAIPRRDALFDLEGPNPPLHAAEFASRMALLFDLPGTQLDLGRRLVRVGVDPANGYTAQGLALMVMGRPLDGLAQLDSAAVVEATPGARREAALVTAELRVILPAVGVLDLPEAEKERGRARLRDVAAGSSSLALQAAWALGLDACGRGDVERMARWRRTIPEGEAGEPARLRRLMDGCEALALGDPHRTLAVTEPLLEDQFLPRPRVRDPFTRTVLHVLRARAFEALGQDDAALRERRWSDNSDITERLGGPVPVQAVEVDWVASPYSDRRRVHLALAVGDTAVACRLLDRLEWLWSDPEPGVAAVWQEDRSLREALCR